MTAAVSIAQSGVNNVTMRNRIINGAMGIAQRGTTAVNATGLYPVDRWRSSVVTSSKLSYQQNLNSATPPSGFTNYLGVQSLAATSPAATDYYGVYQVVEGLNAYDFDFGKSTAKPVAISFWVQSSVTGAHSAALENYDQTRSYCFSYTINSANTWEQKTVTIPGDTTGTWATDNSGCFLLWFNLNSGSNALKTANAWNAAQGLGVTGTVGIGATLNATWYVTGVQLEKGTTATPFEQRLYGTELALCQRYYFRNNYTGSNKSVGMFQAYASGGVFGKFFDLPVQMRSVPTCSASSYTHFSASQANSALSAFTSITFSDSTQNLVASGGLATAGSLVAGNASNVVSTSSSGWIDASAEL